MSEIITEYRNENTKNIDLLSTIDIVRKINEEDQIVARAVEDESINIARAIDAIAKQFLVGGKLYYFGAGTSGRLVCLMHQNVLQHSEQVLIWYKALLLVEIQH